ncbi:MAG: 50S ribosomal protein L10 [Candidatus Omnitrophica bacterium]|nr:50S ribosomal protein L10 [Candidatus Omnitrophota bacterium]
MPAIGRLTKEKIVGELVNRLQQAPGVIVTSFRALRVSDAEALRSQLRTQQASYVVAKQSLSRKALEAAGLQELAGVLEGPIGLVLIGPDPSRTSKIVLDFIKAHEGVLELRGGFVDRQVVTAKTVQQLAALPSREQLLAELVATIESPIADVVQTVERLFQDVTYAVEQMGQQKTPAATSNQQSAVSASTPLSTDPERA